MTKPKDVNSATYVKYLDRHKEIRRIQMSEFKLLFEYKSYRCCYLIKDSTLHTHCNLIFERNDGKDTLGQTRWNDFFDTQMVLVDDMWTLKRNEPLKELTTDNINLLIRASQYLSAPIPTIEAEDDDERIG